MALAGAILLGAGPPTVSKTTPAAVDLGAAAYFAVLAGGGVTDTGPSVILGDVGTHPLPAIPDLLDKEASGSVDRAGAKSQQAQRDLASALASVAQLPRDNTVSLVDDQTLAPGVYAVTDAKQGIAASLTLDGQDAPDAVWIFVVAKDLVTAPGSTITLVNGAQACNVFWRVGGSATLASGSTFAGSILAMTSVTAGRGVTIAGRLLARTAAVSLGGVKITVPACSLNTARSAPQPTAAGALTVSSSSRDAVAASPSVLPSYLPIVMLVLLVAAVILGEPRHRYRRRPARREW
jgi:Ice-binding-like